jgi:metallo-beta-lactamase class B
MEPALFGKRLIASMAALTLAAPAATQMHIPRPQAERDMAKACEGRDGWGDPAPPAHVFGNTWYVGTCGITTLLVQTPDGLVLLDGGIPQAASLVLDNVRKLGFPPTAIRWILVSHEHYDHAGAVAELQRRTGAKVIAGPNQASMLRTGKPDPADPQAPLLAKEPMRPAKVAKTQAHGTALVAGGVHFTAWATPAHSPGSTSWTWQQCQGTACRTIAYADSASTISADGYRFSDNPARIKAIRQGLAVIGALPCEIMITPHPSASDLFPRLSGKQPLVDPNACAAYAEAAGKRFAQRLTSETNPPR